MDTWWLSIEATLERVHGAQRQVAFDEFHEALDDLELVQ